MKRRTRIVVVVLCLLTVALIAAVVPTLWGTPWTAEHFYSRVFFQFALRHPMLLSQLRILEPMGLDFHSDDLDDVSVEAQLHEARWLDRQVEILHGYDRDRMTESGRLSYDVLDWFLQDAQQQNRFLFHDYPVNQLDGLQSGLPDFMTETHQIEDLDDAEDYISRLEGFGPFFDDVIHGLRYREDKGILPPRFVLEKALDEMKGFAAPDPEGNTLFTHLESALNGVEASADQRAELLQEAEKTVRETVYPAYGRLEDVVRDQLERAGEDDGVWRLPDGDAFYAMTLRHHTTTDLTPEQIHEMGAREVVALQEEIRGILETEGLDLLSVGSALQELGRDPRFLYPETDQGENELLRDYQAIIDEIDRGLGTAFRLRPKAAVTVTRVPEFKAETSTSAYYNPPPFDGSRPGQFYVNLRSLEEHPRFGMRTLAYHEAIPGHHFQIALAQEMEGVPFFRRVIPFTAYVEGWALYAERLADELSFHPDPYSRLGYLQAQLFRAVRLVVDTGIHHRRWTREQAIDFMRENAGIAESEIVAEIERYIVDPGQACAYMVGQLKILELRERARRELGEGFDLASFHEVILGNGALPLTLLEQQVDAWIAREKGL